MPSDARCLADGSRQFILRPNASLTKRQAQRLLWLAGVPTFALALYCTLLGFWPVLVYAGLEIGVLAWGLRVSMRDSRRQETIHVGADTVCVESQGHGVAHRREFIRYWARVRLQPAQARHHAGRLLIESHGRACEVGRFLNEQERQELARQLRDAVRGPQPPAAQR